MESIRHFFTVVHLLCYIVLTRSANRKATWVARTSGVEVRDSLSVIFWAVHTTRCRDGSLSRQMVAPGNYPPVGTLALLRLKPRTSTREVGLTSSPLAGFVNYLAS